MLLDATRFLRAIAHFAKHSDGFSPGCSVAGCLFHTRPARPARPARHPVPAQTGTESRVVNWRRRSPHKAPLVWHVWHVFGLKVDPGWGRSRKEGCLTFRCRQRYVETWDLRSKFGCPRWNGVQDLVFGAPQTFNMAVGHGIRRPQHALTYPEGQATWWTSNNT